MSEILAAISFANWIGRFCIYAGEGFWIYYKKFYNTQELYDKYKELTNENINEDGYCSKCGNQLTEKELFYETCLKCNDDISYEASNKKSKIKKI